MKKSLIINLSLLAVVLVLALVVWLDPFATPQPTPVPLTRQDPAGVEHISLSKRGHLEFALQRSEHPQTGEAYWKLTAPLEMPANPVKVAGLLALLRANSFRQYQIKSENLAKLGLQPPGWEIQLGDTVVKFGKTEPIDQKRFVLVNGTVHLINDQYSQYSFGSPLMLANLDILPVDKSVTELHLPDKIIKKVNGQWQSTPSMDTVSQNTYKELIDQWRYAQALRVGLADNASHNGFLSDAKAVTVFLESANQPVHFTIEADEQNVIITNEDWGVRYYLTPAVGEKLLQLSSPAQG